MANTGNSGNQLKIIIIVIITVTSVSLLSPFWHMNIAHRLVRESRRPILRHRAPESLVKLWKNVSQHDDFQMVEANDSTFFVYSAYLDDRPASDVIKLLGNQTTAVVRVFSYSDEAKLSAIASGRTRWRCLFWGSKFELMADVSVVNFTETIDYPLNRKQVIPAMLLCPVSFHRCLPEGNGKQSQCWPQDILTAVSVVLSTARTKPINIVRVVDLPLARQQALQRSKDEESQQPSPMTSQSTFTICVRAIFGAAIKVADVVEFIEVYRVFGVEKFYIYYHSSADPGLLECLRNYERIGLVRVIPWNLPDYVNGRVVEVGQELQITECSHRLMYRTKFLASVDFDEFIVPMQTYNWSSMLQQIDTESGLNPDEIASYSFKNRFFASVLHTPDSLKVRKQIVQTALGSVKDERFRTLIEFAAEVNPRPCVDRSKVIARPERILTWHVHYVADHRVVTPGKVNLCVDVKYGVMHHHRRVALVDGNSTQTFDRMWHFKSGIVENLKHSMEVCPT